MKFRAKFEINEYNNMFIIIQVKRLFSWKTLYYDITNGLDGILYWPVMFSNSLLPYDPIIIGFLDKLKEDKEERKKYYIKTIFGYKKLK